jgi:hypothetical protein
VQLKVLATGVLALVLPGVSQAGWADPADCARAQQATVPAAAPLPEVEVRGSDLPPVRVWSLGVQVRVDSEGGSAGVPSDQSEGRWGGTWPTQPTPPPQPPGTTLPGPENVSVRVEPVIRVRVRVTPVLPPATVRVGSPEAAVAENGNTPVTVRVDNTPITVRVNSGQ